MELIYGGLKMIVYHDKIITITATGWFMNSIYLVVLSIEVIDCFPCYKQYS